MELIQLTPTKFSSFSLSLNPAMNAPACPNHGTNNFIFEIEKNDGEKQYIKINRDETLADLHLKTRLSFSNEYNNTNNINNINNNHDRLSFTEIYDDIPEHSSTIIRDIFISHEACPTVKSIPNNERITIFDFMYENAMFLTMDTTLTSSMKHPVYKLYVVDDLYVQDFLQKRQAKNKHEEYNKKFNLNIPSLSFITNIKTSISNCFVHYSSST